MEEIAAKLEEWLLAHDYNEACETDDICKGNMREVLISQKRNRGCLREVLIKNTMKSSRNRFSGCRAAQAQRKAIRTFNGRLRAFLFFFQHQRKQPRQERASTPLAYIPTK